MREHPPADRVADRVHMRRGRAQVLVDHDPGRTRLDSYGVEAELGNRGHAPQPE